MSRLNTGRVLILWFVSVVPVSIITWLVLMLPMINTMRGLPPEDPISAGAGMIVIFDAMVSCMAGLIGAFPVAFLIDQILSRRRKVDHINLPDTRYIF